MPTPPVEDAAERCPVGSGNPTGVNPFSACLRAPRLPCSSRRWYWGEIHISDSVAYFTGVAKSDSIGGNRLDLLNQGDVISLGFIPACPVKCF